MTDITAGASADTDAAPDLVWRTLADIDAWPTFLPGVTRASSAAEPVPGASFRWTNAGTPIRSVLTTVAPGRELSWTGRALWLEAVHANTLERLPNGGTRLTSQETMTGFAVGLVMPSAKLTASLQAFVDAVCTEAARRSAA